MLELKSLKDEVRAAGLFERCEARSWGKLSFFFSIIVGLFILHAHIPIWGSVLLLPVTSFFMASMVMLGHEGSHRGLSTSAFRNRLMFHLTFPVCGGVSAKYWHWKHDGQHHAYPNVADTDPDLLVWPMASTAIEHRRSNAARQWFQRNLQGVMFWPLTFMLVWSMRGSSLTFLYRYAREKGADGSWWADVGCMTLHLILWVVIPLFVFGPWAVALYAGIWTLVGGALAAVFSPGHIGMPIVTEPDDVWRLQFETTRNLTMPKWLSFFFVGLDYQVEHHIFPRIPHQKMPQVAEITRRWTKRNDVPYHEIPYLAGLADSTRFMAKGWAWEPKPFIRSQIPEESLVKAAAA